MGDLSYRGYEPSYAHSILHHATESEFLAWCAGVDAVLDAVPQRFVSSDPVPEGLVDYAKFDAAWTASTATKTVNPPVKYRYFEIQYDDGETLALYRVVSGAGEDAPAERLGGTRYIANYEGWQPVPVKEGGNPSTYKELVLHPLYERIDDERAQAIEARILDKD